MPLVKPEFRPGIVKTDTDLAAEGGFADGNLVRFWQGRAEPIGGWQLHTVETFNGIARGAKAWTTLNGTGVFAFGTNTNLYGVIGGSVRDITPALIRGVEEDIFSTIDGSDTVAVHLPFHRLREGDEVVFSNHQATIGGLTIEGTFTVDEVLTRDRFTITAASNASATVTDGGGFVDVVVPLPEGVATAPFIGYGSGNYGEGPYGQSSFTDPILTWSIDNWGENGLFNPSGYGLFEWQPEQRYLDLAFNGDFADGADGWGLGSGWSVTGGEAVKTAGSASNLSQDVEGVLEPGRVYEVEFTVTRTAGSLKFRFNVGGASPAVIDVGDASSPITKGGTYTRLFRCPADPLDLVWEADAAFAGTVTNISYKLYDKAYRLITAPPRIDSAFVDPKGVVVAIGTTEVEGTYRPTVVRVSDIRNNRAWVPDTGSVASEYVLRGGGGRLLAGIPTRQQNLIAGDDGIFSLQYKGEEGDAYDIQLLGTGCGLISRHAIAEGAGFVFWMSNTGQFFIFRGVGATNLGVPEIVPCTVREDVFDNLDEQQVLKIHAGVNSKFSEVWWWYPDKRDGDEISRAVAFNWTDGPWSTHQLPRTAWIDAGPVPRAIGFGPTGLIYEHEVGNDANGAALGWSLSTAFLDVQDGDTFQTIRRVIPDWARQEGTINLTFEYRNYPNEPARQTGAFQLRPDTRYVHPRVKARQIAMTFSEGTDGAYGRFGALSIDLTPSPARR